MNIENNLKKILPFVDKPSRYTGGEKNQTLKNPDGKIRACLIYPDAYEVGISNTGLKILYKILNDEDTIYCERAYSVWSDMESAMRENNLPLFTLETKTPLREMDVIGFTFQYELLYTNFLACLDLAQIPFESKNRTEKKPFIIAGGPASLNLEPIADFLDAVCIGDGEETSLLMVRTIGQMRRKNKSRFEILTALSEIPGVYVPSLYEVKDVDGFLVPYGKEVTRSVYPDLNEVGYPTAQLIPNFRSVQDRSVVEVARGCSRGCRFCQAGIQYRPVRERDAGKILDLARRSIQSTGYREFSLISLSVSDYSRLNELIVALDEQFTPHGISFSLPSLRIDSFSRELAEKVSAIRKSTLTFAVEGGTDRIRRIINKGISEEELFSAIRYASEMEWKQVKLYFMIGLPQPEGSEEDEAEGIIALVHRLNREFPKMGVTVSIACFVPKPFTPFQWARQFQDEEAFGIIRQVKDEFFRNNKVKVRMNSPRVSELEGVFSRGDRALKHAILRAFEKGARFDGWQECLDLELWHEAFSECCIDPYRYLEARNPESDLPWDVAGSKAQRDFLKSELEKAMSLEMTPDCNLKEGYACRACGICDFNPVQPKKANESADQIEIDEDFLSNIRLEGEAVVSVRFIYEKKKSPSYFSPIDVEEQFSRAFIRANLPVKFSEGFNPHLKLELGWALPVGFESDCEASQIQMSDKITKDEFIRKMNDELPEGLKILSAKIIGPFAKLGKVAHEQLITFSFDSPFSDEDTRAHYEQNRSFEKVTSKKTKMIQMDEYVRSFEILNRRVTVSYLQTDGGARIQDIMAAFTGRDVREAVLLSPKILSRKTKSGVDVLEA